MFIYHWEAFPRNSTKIPKRMKNVHFQLSQRIVFLQIFTANDIEMGKFKTGKNLQIISFPKKVIVASSLTRL